jgi:hypothetical protein
MLKKISIEPVNDAVFRIVSTEKGFFWGHLGLLLLNYSISG